MSTNLALNKRAWSSSYVLPFSPSKAVDGSLYPINRWVSSKIPAWMAIDLGNIYFINRWVVVHMTNSGWYGNYAMKDYHFEGSLDASNWFRIDSVNNNTSGITDRRFNLIKVRYVRVVVYEGIMINPALACISELRVYEAPNVYLKSIKLSEGVVTPNITRDNYKYNAIVSDADSIIITATAEEINTSIKVNNQNVHSGQPSNPIPLIKGENKIEIKTKSKDGSINLEYELKITKTDADEKLTKIEVEYSSRTGVETKEIQISDDKKEYSISLPTGVNKLKITPYADDPEAKILINNSQTVSSGEKSSEISVQLNTRIPFGIKNNQGTYKKEYGLTVK